MRLEVDSLFNLSPGKLFVIAGPCVIESDTQCLQIARHVKAICDRLGFTFVFKASFDKANRSSGSSFRGPGITDGLVVLRRVRSEVNVPVLTDVHAVDQTRSASEVVDILQVPAFLSRQTDLLLACAHTGCAINVKKGQFMSPAEMENVVEKIRMAGNDRVMLTERGTFFGYNRLVNDFTAIPEMASFGKPIVFDITHSTQQPGGLGTATGGNSRYSPLLARAAVAAGVNGIFLECHPDPPSSPSDASTILALDSVEALLTSCAQIVKLRSGWTRL